MRRLTNEEKSEPPERVALVVMGTSGDARAQGAGKGRGCVAFRGGVNLEHAQDDVAGRSGAASLALGVWFARRWTAEVDVWVPAFGTAPRIRSTELRSRVEARAAPVKRSLRADRWLASVTFPPARAIGIGF